MYQRLLKKKKHRDEKCVTYCIFCKEYSVSFIVIITNFFFYLTDEENQSTGPGVRKALQPVSFPSSKIQALNSFKLLRAGYYAVRCF